LNDKIASLLWEAPGIQEPHKRGMLDLIGIEVPPGAFTSQVVANINPNDAETLARAKKVKGRFAEQMARSLQMKGTAISEQSRPKEHHQIKLGKKVWFTPQGAPQAVQRTIERNNVDAVDCEGDERLLGVIAYMSRQNLCLNRVRVVDMHGRPIPGQQYIKEEIVRHGFLISTNARPHLFSQTKGGKGTYGWGGWLQGEVCVLRPESMYDAPVPVPQTAAAMEYVPEFLAKRARGAAPAPTLAYASADDRAVGEAIDAYERGRTALITAPPPPRQQQVADPPWQAYSPPPDPGPGPDQDPDQDYQLYDVPL
jgi:hypothetical protein